MRKVREVMRLRHEFGYSPRKIGKICCIGRTTAQEYLLRAKAAGITWPLPEGTTDEELENILYSKKRVKESGKTPVPGLLERKCQVKSTTFSENPLGIYSN